MTSCCITVEAYWTSTLLSVPKSAAQHLSNNEAQPAGLQLSQIMCAQMPEDNVAAADDDNDGNNDDKLWLKV